MHGSNEIVDDGSAGYGQQPLEYESTCICRLGPSRTLSSVCDLESSMRWKLSLEGNEI